ncbi:MAG: ATP-binding protein [Labedaea sp.]
MHDVPGGPDPRRVGNLEGLARELDLLRRRAARGSRKSRVTFTDLADRLELPRSTVHTYVAARTLPPVEVLDRIVIELGASPAEQSLWGEAWYRIAGHLHERRHPGPTKLSSPPRQLPPDVADFTGRQEALAALDSVLTRHGTVVVSAVAGMAGVGKTALAVHWAHRVADRFPDGQLYVNLHGYDVREPRRPADVLGGFLRALGVPGDNLPQDVEERTARFRTALAGRRVLVLLDNAGNAEQVRDLLPATPGCLVVITSRDALAGLVARDGARRVDLDLLPEQDCLQLLRTLLGPRVDADPDAAGELTRRCARLPLALRVAAELVRDRETLAGVAADLGDAQRRLDLLDAGGDVWSAVRTVFAWSYRQLPDRAAELFRLFPANPGPDLDVYGVAALVAADVREATALLAVLRRAHLVTVHRPGRYAMHDLLRDYAAELAAAGRAEALDRLLDHYQFCATTAMDTCYPSERDRRPRVSAPDTPAPPLSRPDEAKAWLDAERDNLVGTVVHAAQQGEPARACLLAATLWRYLDSGSHHDQALTVHNHALVAARAAANGPAEATALRNLSTVWRNIGDYEQSLAHARASLAVWRQVGDEAGEAAALNSIAIVSGQLARFTEAFEHYERALAIRRRLGDRRAEAAVLLNMAYCRMEAGWYEHVQEYLESARALFQEVGDRLGEVHAEYNLGSLHRRLARYPQAIDHHRRCLTAYREMGQWDCEARAQNSLALDHTQADRPEEAVHWHQQALDSAVEHRNRGVQVDILNAYGDTLCAAGRTAEARAKHRAASILAEELGNKLAHAHALAGIAKTFEADGETEEAVRRRQEADTLFAELGVTDPGHVPPVHAGRQAESAAPLRLIGVGRTSTGVRSVSQAAAPADLPSTSDGERRPTSVGPAIPVRSRGRRDDEHRHDSAR